ncbi:hypothetical protein BY996DRAFT_6424445 [Phakopsora pachyrhizi]|nr:hypothetical protein BY996DRAFT_6424445 [Phakopsora pachyrhizi]
MTSQSPPQAVQSILALRPPLATSTRTDLAPSFKLLRSVVEAVYGVPGRRGIEPGLWQTQMTRATQRSAELLQAVWSKFGGQSGVTIDDEGESGRGVMKLQGLLSDLQMFASSLASIQDPLTTILLEPEAFKRTQTTIKSLIKKLAGLIAHYNVADMVSSPPDQWPEQDKVDREEDLAALPILIAKSRPNKEVLRRFEVDLALREQEKSKTDVNDDDNDSNTQIESIANETGSSSPGVKSEFSPTNRSRRSLSVANSGLSGAKRSDFLRFVYSCNPHLISEGTDIETAVSIGTAAVSSMGSAPKSYPGALSAAPDGSRNKRSLVQQRISSFASTGDRSPPAPTPSLLPHQSAANRRIVSDSNQSVGSRKSWAVDMSGLDAVQRRSSESFSRVAISVPRAPKVSITAPPVRWRTSSILSRSSTSANSPQAAKVEVDDLKPTLARSPTPSSSVAENPEEQNKPPSIASFAEQAAALVAARNNRSLSQSTPASWTKNKDSASTKKESNGLTASLSSTADDQLNNLEDVDNLKASNSLLSKPTVSSTLEEKNVNISSDPIVKSSSSLSSLSDSLEKNEVSASHSSSEIRSIAGSASDSQPLTGAPDTSRPSPSLAVPSSIGSPPINSSQQMSRSALSTSTSSTSSSGARRIALAPPEPDLNFELVPNLIEHTCLLDVILTPSPPPPGQTQSSPLDVPSVATDLDDATEKSLDDVPQSPYIPSSPTLKTFVAPQAESSDVTSLQDLLERASMFENWTPNVNVEKTSETRSPAPELSEKLQPKLQKLHPEKLANGSFTSLSPPISPNNPAPLSPPSTAPSYSAAVDPSPIKSDSPLSPQSNALEFLPFDQLSALSKQLTISESVTPARPSSGHSWATSLMSVSYEASELDQSLLGPGVGRVRSLSIISGSVPPPNDPLKSGWRILCLDGGGVRGLSMLYIVQSILAGVRSRLGLKKTPLACECFEMICGVGTGGIIALLLGRLRLSIESAIVAYLKIVRNVFGQGKGVLAALRGKTRFSASKLEAAMRDVLKSVGESATLSETNGRCKTFVMTMRVSQSEKTGESNSTPKTLRSYPTRKFFADRCTIYQAARATSASPLFFKPVQVESDPLGSVPNDASLNNPSLEAINEARTLFADRPIDCLISIGAGRGAGQESGSIAKACAEIAESCENAARAVEATAREEGWLEKYSRFSIERSADDDSKSEWDHPDSVEARVAEYLFKTGKAGIEKQIENLSRSWKLAYDGEDIMQPGGKFIHATLRTSSSEDRLFSNAKNHNYLGSSTNQKRSPTKSISGRSIYKAMRWHKGRDSENDRYNEGTGDGESIRLGRSSDRNGDYNRDSRMTINSSSTYKGPAINDQPVKLPELNFD